MSVSKSSIKCFQLHVGNQVVMHLASKAFLKRFSFDLQKEMLFDKHDIINADTQMQSLIEKGIDIKYGHFSNRKSLKALWSGGWRLRKLCKTEGIDILHVFWGTTTSLMAVLFSPVPVVISFSGSDLLGEKNSVGKLTFSGNISRKLSILSGYFSKAIITKSEIMKSGLPKVLRKKTHVIPNGVDLIGFSAIDKTEARKILKWHHNDPVVLFFSSNDAPVKNRKLAKAVFDKIQVSLPSARFFEISGGIDHVDLKFYYNASDLMLLTSFHEGSNNSLKEAMACNLPIVSVPCGDSPERLRDVVNCYVSNNYDVQELADGSIKILASGKRSNGRENTDKLSLSYVANQIIVIYQKILER
jgi:teichuronic acid biosynthesis glycosyltransferase TuaC